MKNAVIYETKFWRVILADDQYCIGRCVVDVKRDVGALRDLSSEEWKDFKENVVVKLENAMIRAFGAEMFNWSCLMNNAYKPEIEKPHPHVHFHVRGRYRKPVEFGGETFHDEDFGHHYKKGPGKEKRVSQEVFDKIREAILKEILD